MPKEPETKVPSDLRKALSESSVVEGKWKALTPIGRRDFITWVEQAKQAETRTRRIEKAASMLKSGKRRPCCFAIVPMNLYKALGVDRKAKAQWRELSATEKRDYVAWVESASDSDSRAGRVSKACDMLAAGKTHP